MVNNSNKKLPKETLIPVDGIWRYLDNGSDQRKEWKEIYFDDSHWRYGPAKLGYGQSHIKTIVDYGGDCSRKYITTYFRKSFEIQNPSIYKNLILKIMRDDGAVVYLNGKEIFRTNMPSGYINYKTLASEALRKPEENTFVETIVSPQYLISGKNVISVEIHQANSSSSDIVFNFELIGEKINQYSYNNEGTEYMKKDNESFGKKKQERLLDKVDESYESNNKDGLKGYEEKITLDPYEQGIVEYLKNNNYITCIKASEITELPFYEVQKILYSLINKNLIVATQSNETYYFSLKHENKNPLKQIEKNIIEYLKENKCISFDEVKQLTNSQAEIANIVLNNLIIGNFIDVIKANGNIYFVLKKVD